MTANINSSNEISQKKGLKMYKINQFLPKVDSVSMGETTSARSSSQAELCGSNSAKEVGILRSSKRLIKRLIKKAGNRPVKSTISGRKANGS